MPPDSWAEDQPRYTRDRTYGDSYMPLAKSILGQSAFSIAPDHQDMKQATDILTSFPRRGQIALRVRRYEDAKNWPWEVTIRSEHVDDRPTEIHKLREGWCDWILYMVPKSLSQAHRYYLLDVDKWREMDRTAPDAGRILGNVDGRTKFRAYDVRRMPPGTIIDWKNEVYGAPWRHGRALPPHESDPPYTETTHDIPDWL